MQRIILLVLYCLPTLYITHYLEKFYNYQLKNIFEFLFLLLIILLITEHNEYHLKKYIMKVSGHFVMMYMLLLFLFLMVLLLHFVVNINAFIEKNILLLTIIFVVFYAIYSLRAHLIYRNIFIFKREFNYGSRVPFRFVAVTDVHLNVQTKASRVEKLVSSINKQNPEIVVFVGDVIDAFASSVKPEIQNVLKKIDAPLGVYGILGNHEFYGDIDENMKFLQNSGIQLLLDEVLEINDDISFLGRTDVCQRDRKSLEEMLTVVRTPIKILLEHRPLTKESTQENIQLQISGHTHGGQLFPLSLFYKFIYRPCYGYKRIKNTDIIVSSGFDTSYSPYRTGGGKTEFLLIDIK
ncbi:MAG: metallophosphoesterase [Fusobacteria bacterium]|nr:metallophosphoesterase [Fusobacteriota bacterium]